MKLLVFVALLVLYGLSVCADFYEDFNYGPDDDAYNSFGMKWSIEKIRNKQRQDHHWNF
jgi:hypothetical protein